VEKKKQAQTILGVLMMVFLLIAMIPGVSIAAVDDEDASTDNYTTLRSLTFVSDADSTLIIGEKTTVNLKLNRLPSSSMAKPQTEIF